MAELDHPYLFRYIEDPADELSRALGRPPPLRPVVAIRLSHLGTKAPSMVALVDSGSERTLAAPSLARILGINLEDAVSGRLGIGGDDRAVRFTTVHLELFEELFTSGQTPLSEWDGEVGFLTNWTPSWPIVLGQVGFFDEFTVTMHRGAGLLAVEPWGTFDERHGMQIEDVSDRQPRFKL